MLTFLKMLRRDERGVSALEYAILAGLIVVALTAVIDSSFFEGIFDNLSTKVTEAAG